MKRRSPLGFVEALARRIARASAPAPELPFRYVFIVAYARSESTRLQQILASIDGFHMTGENADALAGLFFSYQSACRARREEGLEPATERGDPQGADRIQPEQYARTLARAFVDEILQPPARARMIGLKEVHYFDRLDDFDAYVGFMRMAFAPAFIVFNKRDATGIAQSAWWRNYPRDPLTAEIERFDTLAARYVAAHPEDTILVDYDVYSREVAALQPMFDRLGVPFDPRHVQRIVDTPLDR